MTIKPLYPASRPSLDLNFAATKRLDPRITYSRASTGTYFGADGLLKSAAVNEARFDHSPSTGESLGLLVEEARTNLVTDQNLSTYPTGVILIPETSISNPFGNVDGVTKIQCTASTDGHGTTAGISLLTSGNGVHSIFVKKGNHRYVALESRSNLGGGYSLLYFDFDTETITNGNRGNNASFVKYPNGWYRLYSTNAQDGNNPTYGFRLLGSMNFLSWAATGNEFVYYYGPQLEAGSFPTSYIPTPATFTGRSSTATFYDSAGVIQTAASGVARSAAFFPDSNGVMRPAGLLLEAAATNLLTYSQEFDNAAWTKNGTTVTANVTTAPDGTASGDKIIVANGATNADIRRTAFSTNGVASFYAKSAGFDFIGGEVNTAAGSFPRFRVNLLTGQCDTSEGVISISSQNVGNGWWRISVVGNFGNNAFIITPRNDYAFGFTGITGADGIKGIFLWGFQLEVGSYATSYIPTTTATVTRSADVSSSATVTRSADVAQITGSNFSSWYNQDVGTMYVEDRGIPSGGSGGKGFSISGPNTTFSRLGTSGANQAWFDSWAPGGIQDISYITTANIATKNKHAAGLADNNTSYYKDGVLVGTDTSCKISGRAMQTAMIGDNIAAGAKLNGTISRLTYWPTRLSDATLQAITR